MIINIMEKYNFKEFLLNTYQRLPPLPQMRLITKLGDYDKPPPPETLKKTILTTVVILSALSMVY